MTAKEAIQRLRLVAPLFDGQNRQAIDKAIEALEKQIPKKPDYEGDGYDDSGNLIYDTYYCPNCYGFYEIDYDRYNFCPNCGQRLDWGDEE